jgi:hypothetical protein
VKDEDEKRDVVGRIVEEREGFIQAVGEHVYEPLNLVGLFMFEFIPLQKRQVKIYL